MSAADEHIEAMVEEMIASMEDDGDLNEFDVQCVLLPRFHW